MIHVSGCDLLITVPSYIYMEKEMATHSNILAWRIPQTEESGGLQSLGLQKIGHNGAPTNTQRALATWLG